MQQTEMPLDRIPPEAESLGLYVGAGIPEREPRQVPGPVGVRVKECREIRTPARDPDTTLEVVLDHDPVIDEALKDRKIIGDTDAIA